MSGVFGVILTIIVCLLSFVLDIIFYGALAVTLWGLVTLNFWLVVYAFVFGAITRIVNWFIMAAARIPHG